MTVALDSHSALLWESSAASSQGLLHDQNEDAYTNWPEAGLFVVADGMGGHAEGGLASRSIIEILRCVVDEQAELAMRVAFVEEAIEAINTALRRKAENLPVKDVIGSTVAALVVDQNMAVCLWVGDSRIYLHSRGALRQLTRDHNLAEDGDLAEGYRNVLTRAVGCSDDVPIDRVVTAIQSGDTLLVCSDGLTKAVDDDAIAELLPEPVAGLAERLVARAVAGGGRDDITAIVVRYQVGA